MICMAVSPHRLQFALLLQGLTDGGTPQWGTVLCVILGAGVSWPRS